MKKNVNLSIFISLLLVVSAFDVSSQTVIKQKAFASDNSNKAPRTLAMSNVTDYVLNGHAQVVAFVAGATGVKETVGNLSVSGADITQTDFNSLANRVGAVNGTIKFENLTYPGTIYDGVAVSDFGGFFKYVTINGGMVFRNCPYLTWANGINGVITHVHGDFIEDGCSVPIPNNEFCGNFQEVDGDFIITNSATKFWYGNCSALTRVGGNFEISNPVGEGAYTWELGFENLQFVGGNFTINGGNLSNLSWWTLDPLKSMQHIGGNVKIVNIPNLKISGQGNFPYGYCYVRHLIDTGVIDYAHHKVEIGNGQLIDLATLGGCADGITPENPPKALPTIVTNINDLKESITKISVTNEALIIYSKVDLSKVEVFNLTGLSLLQFSNVQAGISSHSVSSLLKGIYVIKLTAENNNVAVYKVLK